MKNTVSSEKTDHVTPIYIAGSSTKNGQGWAWLSAVGEAAGAVPGASAYRLELRGLYQALVALDPVPGPLEIRGLSERTITMAQTKLWEWKAAGWRRRGKSAMHLDLLRALAPLLAERSVTWVPRRGTITDPLFEDVTAQARAAGRDLEEHAIDPIRGTVAVFPDTPRVFAYTDGGCRKNPGGPGGWGFILIDMKRNTALERRGGAGSSTNNRMELTAVIEALEALRGSQHVELRSDSKYVINMCEQWLPGWRHRGFVRVDGEPVKNADLARQLDPLLRRHRVRFRWVPGHSGEPGNDRADQLASASIDALEEGRSPKYEMRHAPAPFSFEHVPHPSNDDSATRR